MPLIKGFLRSLKAASPKTWISGGGSSKEAFFTERKRNLTQLERYRIIYDQGGIVTEAIYSYPFHVLKNGYRLEGPDAECKVVQDWLDATDFEGVVWDAITDALVFGDAFQEIVPNKDGTPAYIVPRLASEFSMQYDNHGHLAGYSQKTASRGNDKSIPLKPSQILHLQFWRTPGSMYGHSLIHRAYDDIMRDTRIIEATAEAIKRHGFKKQHIRVGRDGDTRDVPQATLDAISDKFKTLDDQSDFTTTRNIELVPIDGDGLAKVDTYNNISIMRLSSALGVPEEVLGLRRGSTDATAVKRISVFYDKIAALQTRIARRYNLDIIYQLTSRPGVVKLVWNSPDVQDEKTKAEWIATIMNASEDPFAVLPQAWIRKEFAIEAETE